MALCAVLDRNGPTSALFDRAIAWLITHKVLLPGVPFLNGILLESELALRSESGYGLLKEFRRKPKPSWRLYCWSPKRDTCPCWIASEKAPSCEAPLN